MIFVTVGGQLPFDRLIGLVDVWAASHPEVSVFAQIGRSELQPKHLDYAQMLPGAEFLTRLREAEAIVGHAGMGTILNALEEKKPLLIFPRLAAQGEHRNDHQIATARYFSESGQVQAAFDESELLSKLDSYQSWERGGGITPWASPQLLDRVRSFVFGEGSRQASPRATEDTGASAEAKLERADGETA